MSFDDFQRGVRDGYQGLPTAPARSASEMLGRNEGAARRDQERHRATAADGYESLPPRYGLYLILVFAVFAVSNWRYDARLDASLLMVGVTVALLLTRRMRAILRGLTPLYLGLCAGAAWGGWSLVQTGNRVTMGKLAVPLIVGGVLGIAYIVLARRRRA